MYHAVFWIVHSMLLDCYISHHEEVVHAFEVQNIISKSSLIMTHDFKCHCKIDVIISRETELQEYLILQYMALKKQ